jgi:L-fuconolactonase
MFGSDWPVCLLAGTYDDVVAALLENLGDLTAAELEDIFRGNASRFYRI